MMSILQPAAVLWDMDGTIVDTELAWLRAERNMLAEWGSVVTLADELDWVGIGLWDLAVIFQERGVNLEADEIVYELARRVDIDIFAGELDWRPGARELIADLHEVGIPNVLVTMSTRSQAERVVAQFPSGSFHGIMAGDDVSNPKPHPEPYERGAALVGGSATDCLAVEDSLSGAASAYAAGAVVVGVTNLVDLSGSQSHVVLDSLEHLDATGVCELFTAEREEV